MSDSAKSKSEEKVDTIPEKHLELPDGAAFTSRSPKVDILEMIAISERYLPIVNGQPDFVERKIREAITVPFSLR